MARIDSYRHPYQVVEIPSIVHLHCNYCNTTYELEVQDVLDIEIDGVVICECGAKIEIPWELRIGEK